MNTPEADMFDTLIQHLIKVCDAKFWCEVKVPSIGTADAVGLIGGRYFIFEGKAKLSYGLLAQCVRWKTMCSGVNAVVPYTTREDEETQLALEHFRSNGISVAMIGSTISYPVSIEKTKNNFTGIRFSLRDSQIYGGKFARSGASGGRRGSKANEEFTEIENWVKSNPDQPAKDAGRQFKMKASKILKLIKDGKLRVDAKDVGGITHLFPKGANQ